MLPAASYSQKYYNRWKAFRTKPCLYHQNGVCRYGKNCRFLHDIKEPTRAEDINQIKDEMKQKINELMALIHSQTLTMQNQASQLIELNNSMDILKGQLSLLLDDFCQMKKCSDKADKEFSKKDKFPSP